MSYQWIQTYIPSITPSCNYTGIIIFDEKQPVIMQFLAPFSKLQTNNQSKFNQLMNALLTIDFVIGLYNPGYIQSNTTQYDKSIKSTEDLMRMRVFYWVSKCAIASLEPYTNHQPNFKAVPHYNDPHHNFTYSASGIWTFPFICLADEQTTYRSSRPGI